MHQLRLARFDEIYRIKLLFMQTKEVSGQPNEKNIIQLELREQQLLQFKAPLEHK
jgi:hypothetical protein